MMLASVLVGLWFMGFWYMRFWYMPRRVRKVEEGNTAEIEDMYFVTHRPCTLYPLYQVVARYDSDDKMAYRYR